MKTVMAKNNLDSSSSKRHFHWTKKVGNEENDDVEPEPKPSSSFSADEVEKKKEIVAEVLQGPTPTAEPDPARNAAQALKKKLPAVAVARLRSVLTAFGRNRAGLSSGLGNRVVGTLFGSRRGHVHFAFQKDPNSEPAFLIELATPISGLVREMASGLVRIALECDKEREREEEKLKKGGRGGGVRLLEENIWRTYCNGKKSGFATRRNCGPKDWKILKAVEPISMGAGVLPGLGLVEENNNSNDNKASGSDNGGGDGGGGGGELMYMRAKFERIVGSRDSEAFYMMNPDSNGAPELSIYLLRV
ncbi:protein MIZU-KUSSEI 1 [Humulus lupulus]|uniref:protein MIZU-KUSSEI 1 n=1 Tax=Humulus lupulus TaxID=3486 RepID=UPI002B41320D|nr:protein MIZU-KUSSEI 1 [Humulus lupulus]